MTQAFYIIKIIYTVVVRCCHADFLPLINERNTLEQIQHSCDIRSRLISEFTVISDPGDHCRLVMIVCKKSVEDVVSVCFLLPVNQDISQRLQAVLLRSELI